MGRRCHPVPLRPPRPHPVSGAARSHFWARHHFGNTAAVLATGLFTLLPPVLAHAGLATTDMALAACLGAAFFSLVLWAEKPTLPRTLLLGAAAGGEDPHSLPPAAGFRRLPLLEETPGGGLPAAAGLLSGHSVAGHDQPRQHRCAPHSSHLYRFLDHGWWGRRFRLPTASQTGVHHPGPTPPLAGPHRRHPPSRLPLLLQRTGRYRGFLRPIHLESPVP